MTPDAGSVAEPISDREALADLVFHAVLVAVRPRIPRATYRLQLHQGFPFDDARALLDYLDALGVSDLYVSPPFQARPGSLHGYDVVDQTRLSADLGDRDAFDALTASLAARDMGLLVDTVPNHMGIGGAGNAWWTDVLENGPSSLYTDYFDIDWHPLKSELENKVLLPVLGDHYGRVLDRGELSLRYERGAFFLGYWEWSFPITPRTFRAILEPVIPWLADRVGEEHDAVLELSSILTGAGNLPSKPESRRARAIERHREKESLKRRLANLVAEWSIVGEAIAKALQRLNGRSGDPRSFDSLHSLLEDQYYRLSFYRAAAEEINYRRFFDINDLAAVRMENPAVFAEAHRLLMELLGDGRVTGLRIDHPDGLWDPGEYLADLQRGYFLERCRREFLQLRGRKGGEMDRVDSEAWTMLRPALGRRYAQALDGTEPDPRARRPLYLIVEKILSRGEHVPEGWPCHGTVGYEFGALLTSLFVDHSHEREISATYARATGLSPNFAALVYQKKKLVLQSSLASELNVLAHALNRLSERNRDSRDFTLGTLTRALVETIAWFPAYRTYVNPRGGVLSRDRQLIERAIRTARRRSPTTDPSVYTWLQSVLLLELPPDAPAEDTVQARELVMRFQQLTGPVMAKGLEDTAFYVYNRMTSLNEVGGEPERFGVTLSAFHLANQERLRAAPHSMLASSTHDTKRGEDVRARISVLSEIPEVWDKTINALYALAADERGDVEGELAPDANEEYLVFQTIAGTLPPQRPTGEALRAYTDRIAAYMLKALREAKVNTSWINPNLDHEAAVERFVRGVLREGGPVLDRLDGLCGIVAFHGMWSALSQLLLKLTVPGVPDLYQGSEMWELRLVDPDNRRPVDYARRRAALDEIRRRRGEGAKLARELVETAGDGRIKLFVTHVVLELRRELPSLFEEGAYRPIAAVGEHEAHVVAFVRAAAGDEVLVVAPRFTAKLARGERRPPVGAIWADTHLSVEAGTRWANVFTGEAIEAEPGGDGAAEEGRIPLARLLANFPLALLRRE